MADSHVFYLLIVLAMLSRCSTAEPAEPRVDRASAAVVATVPRMATPQMAAKERPRKPVTPANRPPSLVFADKLTVKTSRSSGSIAVPGSGRVELVADRGTYARGTPNLLMLEKTCTRAQLGRPTYSIEYHL